MRKLLRVVGVRKWFVIGAALLGAAVGYLVTSSLNENRQPAYEATATIEFGTSSDERSRDTIEEDLAEAFTAAQNANKDAIDRGLGDVSSNVQTGLLIFSARAREESVAKERAEEMRSAYLEVTAQGSAEDRQQRLDVIINEAAQVLAQLEELDPSAAEEVEEPEPEIDPVVAARLDVLNALVTQLTSQHTRLEVDLILAEAGDERAGDPDDIQGEMEAISERLDEVYAEIAQISAENGLTASEVTGRQDTSSDTSESSDRTSTVPSGAQSPEEVETQWMMAALESRYEELAAEYESLFVQNQTAPPAELTAAGVADLTPPPASLRVNTGLGLLLGAIIASALAVGEAVLRGRVYVLSDTAPLNGLAEIPAARYLMAGRPGWRVASASPRRVDGIHRLRIALLAMMGSHAPSPAIGLTRVGVDHLEAGMLATDLARRLAASGRSILVLDVDFDADSPYSVPASSTSVADLISMAKADREVAATQMKRAFTEVTSTESFRLIRSGQLKDDPADVVLTDAFRMLLELAREQSDIVLVVTPEAAHHSTYSLQQRLEGMIAICAMAKTRRVALLKLAQPGLTVTAPLGVVLLTGWRRDLGHLRSSISLARVRSSITKAFRAVRARLRSRRPTGNSSSEPGA